MRPRADRHPLHGPARGAGSCRLHKATCEACGYVVRVTSRWLDTAGAPLCPCNGQPMADGRAGVDGYAAPVEKRASTLRKHEAVIARSRECAICSRFHDVGARMEAHAVSEQGKLETRYVCAGGCDPLRNIDYSGDRIDWGTMEDRF